LVFIGNDSVLSDEVVFDLHGGAEKWITHVHQGRAYFRRGVDVRKVWERGGPENGGREAEREGKSEK
jgi:hypothetical protein